MTVPVYIVTVRDRGILGESLRAFTTREKAEAFAEDARKSIGWRSAEVALCILDDATVPR